jgi:hypothetical protein
MEKKVTIGGSYRKHLDRILSVREQFISLGWEVLRPQDTTVVESDDLEFVRLQGDPADAAGIQRAQLGAIEESDLYYVVNPGGYVGPSATAEVAWAAAKGIPVLLAEPAFEQAVRLLADGHGNPEAAVAHIRGES